MALFAVPAIHRAHKSLFYAPLGHIGVRGGLNLCSPSTRLKVNHLYIRYLCFESMRGDLQEGNGCASRCLFPLFPVPIPFLPSTKSGFLCAFGVWNPCFQTFRAQNRGFCAQEEGKVGSESVTAETLSVNVAFLQITARVSKM